MILPGLNPIDIVLKLVVCVVHIWCKHTRNVGDMPVSESATVTASGRPGAAATVPWGVGSGLGCNLNHQWCARHSGLLLILLVTDY
jgi:hypothetical protein